MDDIGPTLPSECKNDRRREKHRGRADSSSPSVSTIGPTMQHNSPIGPSFPPQLTLHASDESDFEDDEEESGVSIGLTIPTRFKEKQESSDDDSYGPQLPASMSKKKHDSDEEYGPMLTGLPSRQKTVDDDDMYGPSLPKPSSSSKPRKGRYEESYGPVLPTKLSSSKTSKDEEDVAYGPSLPQTSSSKSSKQNKYTLDDDDSYGPSIPPSYQNKAGCGMQGPSLPSSRSSRHKDKPDDDDSYGPSLPSSRSSRHRDEPDDDDSYGPSLPPSYQNQPSSGVKESSPPPSKSSHQDDEDNDMIGPLPWMMHSSSDADAGQSAAEEFEARARAMKNKLTGKDEDKAPERESWMTELPGYGKNFGLGPRTFRKRNLPDAGDRSVWTDTPADRARKEKERKEGKVSAKKAKPSGDEVTISDRDKHLSEQISSYNQSKRADSLMEMHSKGRKEKLLAESEKPQERRAFDRETDLQVNRFDEARKKTMMKKAGQLGERFSHSKEKMFL